MEPLLILPNWLYAAVLIDVLSGLSNTGASDVPLMSSPRVCGAGSPASAASVAYLQIGS